MPKKIDFDITWQFHCDLMAAYRRIAPTCWRQAQAWRLVAESPAPRFYISGDACARVLRRIRNEGTGFLDDIRESKKRMYLELWVRFQRLCRNRDYMDISFIGLCDILVMQPAPEFYCSPGTVREVFHRTRNHVYRRGAPDSHRIKRPKKADVLGEVYSISELQRQGVATAVDLTIEA